MQLPFLENAFIAESKITKYLLNLDHQGGGKEKAQFFIRFGFSLSNWRILHDALLEHAHHDIYSQLETAEGIHYVIHGEIKTPDGRHPQIRTVWVLDSESTRPRFITAYPIKIRSSQDDTGI